MSVNRGASQTSTISPDPGHDVADVLLDLESVGPVTSYAFTYITSDHTIAASFPQPSGVADLPPASTYASQANVPNPFNPTTRISFSLPRSERVRLALFDVSGRLVRVLVDEVCMPGSHEVQ